MRGGGNGGLPAGACRIGLAFEHRPPFPLLLIACHSRSGVMVVLMLIACCRCASAGTLSEHLCGGSFAGVDCDANGNITGGTIDRL